MDEFSSGYQPEDYSQGGAKIEEGDYRLKIESVTPGYAQNSGNAMLTIELGIAEASFKLKHFLVKNEYFNANTTKFFDCFKIPRGNFEYNRWIGRVGLGHLVKGKPKDNGKQYMELAYLIVPQTPGAQSPAPQTSRPPVQRQGPAAQPPAQPQDDFDDDIPF